MLKYTLSKVKSTCRDTVSKAVGVEVNGDEIMIIVPSEQGSFSSDNWKKRERKSQCYL